MAEAGSLTLAFMRAHPAEAARALERVPPADAAALFARVPARLAAGVLEAMLPTAAARSAAALDDERAMELLGAARTQPSIAILRHIPEPRRSRLIAGLPTAAALASRMLLGYQEDTVGAWTDPDVIALPQEASVGEALERVRNTDTAATRIYVIETEQRLVGTAELSSLMRAPEGAPLRTVMVPPEGMLPVHAPLTGAISHPAWEIAAALPVVERGDQLVGVLSRATLGRALRRTTRPPRGEDEGTLAGAVARGYWEALSGIVEAATALLPPVGPVKKPNHGGSNHGR